MSPAFRRLSFCVYCLLITAILCAQEFSYITYDKKDGLSGSTVYTALQSRNGFMWFATENGLSRFDGKKFRTYSTADGLPDNDVINVFEDSKQRIWVMAFKPQLAYIRNGTVYSSANDSTLKKLAITGFIYQILEDKHGALFCVEQSVIHIIYPDGTVKKVQYIADKLFLPYKTTIDRNGECMSIVVTNDIPYFFYPATGLLRPFVANFFPTTGLHMLLSAEHVLTRKTGEAETDYLFYHDKPVWQRKSIPYTIHTSFLGNDKIAYNSTNGVFICDLSTGNQQYHLLPNVTINYTYEDKEGNWWLCSKGSGLFRLPSTNIKSKRFYDGNEMVLGVFAITKAHDRIIVGTEKDQLWKKDAPDVYSRFNIDEKTDDVFRITTLIPFDKDQLLIGSNRIRIGTMKENSIDIHSPVFYVAQKSVWLTKKKELLLASSYTTSLVPVSLQFNPDTIPTIVGVRSTCALEKDQGYYVGTLQGLYFKPYEGEAILLGKQFPVLANRITALAIGADNTLWITTIGGGVVAWKDQQVAKVITEKEGLTSNNCLSIFLHKHNVWIGTEKGLNKFSNSGKRLSPAYTLLDGLCSDIINTVFVDSNMVYAGTPNGLSYFNDELNPKTSTCDLEMTGIYVSNKFWCSDTTAFVLPHDKNDLRFEFAGISFKSGGEITYRYRLLGLHKEWRTTSDNVLSFPSLPSGSYILEIQAVNKFGVKSGVKDIAFTIEKLLWEKLWFILSMIALAIGGIWWYIRKRIQVVQQRNDRQAQMNQRIAELEQIALRSQMNPHFIFNSLNSIQQYVAERDIAGANKFITDFSSLIRMTLNLSSESTISLSKELEYVQTYLRLERARMENAFNFEITVDSSANLDRYYIPPLLLQPYIENSIRHGIRYRTDHQGMIHVSIQHDEQYLVIMIEDNGIGRKQSASYKSGMHVEYQSKGMSITRDRIEMLNKTQDQKIRIRIDDLYDQQGNATGTRVNLFFPGNTITD